MAHCLTHDLSFATACSICLEKAQQKVAETESALRDALSVTAKDMDLFTANEVLRLQRRVAELEAEARDAYGKGYRAAITDLRSGRTILEPR